MRKLDRAKQVLAKLEELRAALERQVGEKGVDHPDVLALSQRIYEALNDVIANIKVDHPESMPC